MKHIHLSAKRYAALYYSYSYNHATLQNPALPCITAHCTHYRATLASETTLRYNYNYSSATPYCIQHLWVSWPTSDHWNDWKTHIQPPGNRELVRNLWITTTRIPCRYFLVWNFATASRGSHGLGNKYIISTKHLVSSMGYVQRWKMPCAMWHGTWKSPCLKSISSINDFFPRNCQLSWIIGV